MLVHPSDAPQWWTRPRQRPFAQVHPSWMLIGCLMMLRINARTLLCQRSFVSPSRMFFTFGGFPQSPVVVDADGIQREVLYKGPVNSLVWRTKVASLVSAGTSIVLAPLSLRYLGSDAWTFTSNLFFCSGGTLQSLTWSHTSHSNGRIRWTVMGNQSHSQEIRGSGL